LFAEALEREPALANDRERQHAYNAACAAALAAAMKSRAYPASPVQTAPSTGPAADAAESERTGKPITDTERRNLRNQARTWLRAELARWAKLLESAGEQRRAVIEATLKHWLQDPDLASVRDESAHNTLPDDERQQWQSLWDDVRKLLNRAASEPHSVPERAMPNGRDAFAR
jgi:hypothetical protein